ncbi:hypothetical protein [Bradyrhizobium sp. Ce-3]|uniref:hypothetical protein n=1 Tax=Bradyrhizobium sp. Ce-3 TaxID=2913970 RepID=UPI001FC8C541|nr:hypothetical protein [Bradyrhizobium sp. Ce-3]
MSYLVQQQKSRDLEIIDEDVASDRSVEIGADRDVGTAASAVVRNVFWIGKKIKGAEPDVAETRRDLEENNSAGVRPLLKGSACNLGFIRRKGPKAVFEGLRIRRRQL